MGYFKDINPRYSTNKNDISSGSNHLTLGSTVVTIFTTLRFTLTVCVCGKFNSQNKNNYFPKEY
jgi:hypothetical protein